MPFYEWFYNIILTSVNSVPVQSLWVAFFTNPVDLNRAAQVSQYENGFGYATLVPGAGVNSVQGAAGALFANAVTIPGDGMNVSKLGPEGSGLIKGNISSGRKEMENLTISFLDTNMSFCDYNIRPWAIYASHKSLKDPAVKTSVTILQLAKTGPKKALRPRAIWTFFGACPVAISSQEWNWGADNVVSRSVEFAYTDYILNADPTLAVSKTINDIIGEKRSSQPVSIPRGGLDGHGGSQTVSIPENDATSIDNHPEGQPVILPEDDIVSRGINIGLEILNGNSNVTIESNDAIERLTSIAEELQTAVKNF
jgi:hypothetical protein